MNIIFIQDIQVCHHWYFYKLLVESWNKSTQSHSANVGFDELGLYDHIVIYLSIYEMCSSEFIEYDL